MSRKATKDSRWYKDRALALIAIIIVSILSVTSSLDGLDEGLFGLFNRLTPINLTSTPIDLITVNKHKLQSIGDWPLQRINIANLLKLVASGKPDVIATTLPLENSQPTPGSEEIYHLNSIFKNTGLDNSSAILGKIISETSKNNVEAITKLNNALNYFSKTLKLAKKKMNQDAALSHVISKIKNIDLAYTYTPESTEHSNKSHPLTSLINNHLSLNDTKLTTHNRLITAFNLKLPLTKFSKNATGMGAVEEPFKNNDYLSNMPLAISYRGVILPSLALLVAAQNLHLDLSKIHYKPPLHELKLGTLKINTGQFLRIYPRDYTSGISSYKKFDYTSVLDKTIDPTIFRNKIVLIGTTKPKANHYVNNAGVSLLANQIYSILNQDSVHSPYWSNYVRYGIWFSVSIYLLLLFPFLGKWLVDTATLIIVIFLFSGSFYLFYKYGLWLPLGGPILVLLIGYVFAQLKQIVFGNHGVIANTNVHHDKLKTLGLAFQNQGQLDLAYEQYRQLPVNEYSLELLYSLGLDYQRKKRFDKAHAIYHYIKIQHPEFHDIQEQITRTQTNQNNNLTHKTQYRASTNSVTTILDSDHKTSIMLGRYEVEHEIGRGAMSTVYQGNDPKIGRKVAIKTLLLSEEFEGEELEEVKTRFYREAETAGRLSHPNIVTIFDAGEQDDIAYIAMEYLDGMNLTHHLHKDNLLPVSDVMEIVGKCALALDYAHHHHVIHRDVKPANIVYNPETKSIKLTDFGIARITDASKTRTGVIMGTPSYMSPEQLAGGKSDGRSDLFSLGITCYQLLTGTLPFQADSMATLMFKITNEAHPALNAIRDDLVPCVSPIINKTLQKNPDKRYQTGRALANQLLHCVREMRKETN